jgi:hypothetical protein
MKTSLSSSHSCRDIKGFQNLFVEHTFELSEEVYPGAMLVNTSNWDIYD